jgi:predicted translin family RNA/ssDNA-binding protein
LLTCASIFALQRVRIIGEPIPEKIAKEVNERLNAIIELMKTMAPDLQGINAWRYQRQASPGIQEYIEAVSCKSLAPFMRPTH